MNIRPPRRPRHGAIPSVQAMLDAFDSWKAQNEMDLVTLDIRAEYIYIEPGGAKHIVTREQLTGTGNVDTGPDAWPRPGKYEIHAVDSNDTDLVDPPFQGEHFTADMAVVHHGGSGDDPGIAAAKMFASFTHDSETYLRNQRARLDQAERREAKAKEDLNATNDKLAKALRDNAALVVAKEAAERDKIIAEERQRAAEAERDELKEDIASFTPHVHAAVDHFAEHLQGWLGLKSQNVSNDAGMLPQDSEPPPMGAEDPEARIEKLFSFVLDPRKLRPLVEYNFISWDEARALVYIKTGGRLPESFQEFIASYDDAVAAWYEAHPEDMPDDAAEPQAAE